MSLNLLPSLARLKNKIEEKTNNIDIFGGITESDLDTSSSESDEDEDDSSPELSRAPSPVVVVAKKVIGRLCRVIDKTCISPTATLEQHINWDDIANLAR